MLRPCHDPADPAEALRVPVAAVVDAPTKTMPRSRTPPATVNSAVGEKYGSGGDGSPGVASHPQRRRVRRARSTWQGRRSSPAASRTVVEPGVRRRVGRPHTVGRAIRIVRGVGHVVSPRRRRQSRQPGRQTVDRHLELGVEVDEGSQLLGEPVQAHLLRAAPAGELLDAAVGEVHGWRVSRGVRHAMEARPVGDGTRDGVCRWARPLPDASFRDRSVTSETTGVSD